MVINNGNWQSEQLIPAAFIAKATEGGGGQYIIVLEELDLVVVATAHNKTFNADTLSLTAKRIIPAFIK